jgi:hypothetical protein
LQQNLHNLNHKLQNLLQIQTLPLEDLENQEKIMQQEDKQQLNKE